MLFEFMKLPNQIVIDVPIFAAYNKFYGISVSVGISCQISKTFKHWDSDKFCVSNSHPERSKMRSMVNYITLHDLRYSWQERTFILMEQWWQPPAHAFMYLVMGGILTKWLVSLPSSMSFSCWLL